MKTGAVESLYAAFASMEGASPNDSSKGRFVKDWFHQQFGIFGRAALVNEAKQAYNRPKEQLGHRDTEHLILVAADARALKPLAPVCKKSAYPALKTVLLVVKDGASYKPTSLLVNGASEVANFYRSTFSNIPEESLMNDPGLDGTVDGAVVEMKSDDPVLIKVNELLTDGYAGVILTGAPGTGKSWYARQIALRLVDSDENRVFFVQFHPGYQYEDFVEAYVPSEKGGFELVDKAFFLACARAEAERKTVVLVIDELSRTDTVRVFGEALTYLETSKREIPFTLASGNNRFIPKELVVLATMNPWDRGVDELDLAFERRFAKIEFNPDLEKLRSLLSNSALNDEEKTRLEQFFQIISKHQMPICRIGHAYFANVTDISSLQRLWDHQLHFHFSRVLRNDPAELEKIQLSWKKIFGND